MQNLTITDASKSKAIVEKFKSILNKKSILEFNTEKELISFSSFCKDNIGILREEILNGNIDFESPYSDYIKANEDLSKMMYESEIPGFISKWDGKIIIKLETKEIEPLYIIPEFNLISNKNGIVKVGNTFRKQFNDYLIYSENFNLLFGLNEKDINTLDGKAKIENLKASYNSSKSGYRVAYSLGCIYTTSQGGCNKRRIKGSFNWSTRNTYDPLLPYIFTSDATSTYQNLSIFWYDRNADNIKTTLDHDLLFPSGSLVHRSAVNATGSGNSSASAHWEEWTTTLAEPKNNYSTHHADRNECNGVNINCTNFQSF